MTHDPGDEDSAEPQVRIRLAAERKETWRRSVVAAGLREIYPGIYAPIASLPLVVSYPNGEVLHYYSTRERP
jgi:hypothetical protein